MKKQLCILATTLFFLESGIYGSNSIAEPPTPIAPSNLPPPNANGTVTAPNISSLPAQNASEKSRLDQKSLVPGNGVVLPKPEKTPAGHEETANHPQAESVMYMYRDETGYLRGTDSIDSVPERFRKKAKKVQRRR